MHSFGIILVVYVLLAADNCQKEREGGWGTAEFLRAVTKTVGGEIAELLSKWDRS